MMSWGLNFSDEFSQLFLQRGWFHSSLGSSKVPSLCHSFKLSSQGIKLAAASPASPFPRFKNQWKESLGGSVG